MTFVSPGAGNVQVIGPSNPNAQVALQVGFSKNPARFSYLNAVHRIPSAKTLGVYVEYNADDVARLTSADEDPNWKDGTNRPAPRNISHEIREFQTERDSQTARLGNLTIDQDQIGVVPAQLKAKASLMQLKKSRAFEKLVTDPAVMTQQNTMTALGGGKIGSATTATPYIQKTFNAAKRTIRTNTNGAVSGRDIICMLSESAAAAIAESNEFKDWAHNHRSTIEMFQNTEIFENYGLPPRMHGVGLVVAAESLVTSEETADKTAAATRRELFAGLGTVSSLTVGTPLVFLSREGGVSGPLQPNAEPLNANDLNDFNTPVNEASQATVIEIYKEDMTVENKVDQWNRVTDMGVTSDWVHKVTSVRSGYLVRDAL